MQSEELNISSILKISISLALHFTGILIEIWVSMNSIVFPIQLGIKHALVALFDLSFASVSYFMLGMVYIFLIP